MRTTSGGRYLFTTSDENAGNVKKGALARHVFGKNRFIPAQILTPLKNDLEALVRVIVPRIIIIITRRLL